MEGRPPSGNWERGSVRSSRSGRSRTSVFFSSSKRGDDRAAQCWRRFLATAKKQDLNAKEMVVAWSCPQKHMSYSEFMRGLVLVLGANSKQFSHSERKRLFKSLQPNRDGLVDVDDFSKKVVALEAAMESEMPRSASPTTSTGCLSEVGTPRNCDNYPTSLPRSPCFESSAPMQDVSGRTSAREAHMRYRRERLLSANLTLRTALLDKKPVLCCRLSANSPLTAAETAVLDGGTVLTDADVVWDASTPNSTIGDELAALFAAPVHGVCETLVSYGEDTLSEEGDSKSLVYSKDGGLLWEAVSQIHAEIDALTKASALSSEKNAPPFQRPTCELALESTPGDPRRDEWTPLPNDHIEAVKEAQRIVFDRLSAGEGTKVARVRVHDPAFGPCGELRLASVPESAASSIDVDDVEAWFSNPDKGIRNNINAGNHTKIPTLGSYAARWAPQTLAYCVVHLREGPQTCNKALKLAELRNRVEHAPQFDQEEQFHLQARESVLPLPLLRQRRYLFQQEKQLATEISETQGALQQEENFLSTVDLIKESTKRLEALDRRELAGVASKGVMAREAALEKDLALKEETQRLAAACKKQRLRALDRASRLQAALGRIQVVCRIRPLLDEDTNLGPPAELRQSLSSKAAPIFVKRAWKGRHVSIDLRGHKLAAKSRVFEFDDVWDEYTSQEEVFESVENLANDVLSGRTASVFAYGCTGGGKSYTVVGDLRSEPPRLGIAFQSVELLLASLKNVQGTDGTVLLSMLEVHNEEVYDLLKPEDADVPRPTSKTTHFGSPTSARIFTVNETGSVKSEESGASLSQASDLNSLSRGFRGNWMPNLRRLSSAGSESGTMPRRRSSSNFSGDKIKLNIRLAQSTGKAHVPDLTKVTIGDMGTFLRVFEAGNRRRATTATLLNEHSSRSHVLLVVETQAGGRLCLVDLAGCERVAKSGAAGDVLKEATSINKSLSALGDCFEAIDRKRAHVPYRNSKLTFLLSDVIGGPASRCLFVFAASPVWKTVPETLSSFKFAARMSSIHLDGEMFTEKQKHVDAIAVACGARKERALLMSFLRDLNIAEQESLKRLTEEAKQRLTEEANAALNDTGGVGADAGFRESQVSNKAEDAMTPRPNLGALSRWRDSPFDQGSEVSDLDSKLETISVQSESHRRVDHEIQQLWRRLRATQADLAALREATDDPKPPIGPSPAVSSAAENEDAVVVDGNNSNNNTKETCSATRTKGTNENEEEDRIYVTDGIEETEVDSVPPPSLSDEVEDTEIEPRLSQSHFEPGMRRPFDTKRVISPHQQRGRGEFLTENYDLLTNEESLTQHRITDEVESQQDYNCGDDDEVPHPLAVPPSPEPREAIVYPKEASFSVVFLDTDGSDAEDEVSVIEPPVQERASHTKDIDVDIIAHDDEFVPGGSGCAVSMLNMMFCEASPASETGTRFAGVMARATSGRKLVVAVHQARGLVPDSSMGRLGILVNTSTNPYVVCKYGDQEQVTHDDLNTLAPRWDSDMVFSYAESKLPAVTLYLFSTNTYMPDSLLGKCVVNFKRPKDHHGCGGTRSGGNKPHVLLQKTYVLSKTSHHTFFPRSWLPIVPCVEHERNLIRHFVCFVSSRLPFWLAAPLLALLLALIHCGPQENGDKAFGLHLRHPRFLYKKGALGTIEVSAYTFVLEHR